MQSFDHDAVLPPHGDRPATGSQEHLDALCRTASELFRTPVALIPLLDEDRFWFRAGCGVAVDGIDREGAFCSHTIRRARGQALVVPDLTLDARFAHSPLVVGPPHLRFYAGVAIGSITGRTIGTFCVVDMVPRPDFSGSQVRDLQNLALLAEAHLQLQERLEAAEIEAREQVRVEGRLVAREAALRVSQAAHAMAERTACFGHWRVDAEKRTIAWSEGVARIFGRNEALNLLAVETHITYYHPDDRAKVIDIIDEALAGRGTAGGGGYEHRSRVIRPDGEERVVSVHGIAQHDDVGRLVALFGVCLDVTDLARSERQQRESGEVLRTTLEAMDQGLMMIEPDGRIRVHNQRARSLLGLPETLLHEGAQYADVLRFQIESGEFRSAPPEVRSWLTGRGGRPPISRYERTRPNGVVVEVRIAPTKSGGTVCTYTDVTERRQAEAALRAAEADYQSLFNNAVIGVYRACLDGSIVQANRALARLHGYGDGCGILVSEGAFGHDWYVDADRNAAFLELLHRDGRVEDFVSEVRRHADGETIWVSETAWLVPGPDGGPGGYEGTVADATERKRAEALVEHIARHDALTGLPNRRLFQETLGRELVGARRRGGRIAVLCCDLDRFKAVNDTFGHPAGDAVLRIVAERLGSALRDGDMVARLGGDEFAIILRDQDETRRVAAVARRIIQSLRRPIDLDGLSAAIGVSIGIAVGPEDGDSPETLFKNADIALYRAKDSGRNAFRFYECGMDAAVVTRNLLELDLRDALRTGGFALHYQPIFALTDGAPSGFEALLRWNHPVRGAVSPAEFIPVAEESGLIVPLGTWALNEACREAASWPGAMRIAVNVSAVQFRKHSLEQTVVRALAASGLPARRLELEITESVLMQDSDAVVNCLHRLRAMGVRIALDDFGTGYSSLSYLCQFPFDKIKVDRSFVRDLDNPVAAAIVRAIVGIGERLGSSITAEGVETEEQLERLRHKGCTEVQGFLLSRPMPAEEARAFMRGRASAAA